MILHTLFSVLLLEQFPEYSERDRGLGGGAGLGDHIHGDLLALADLEQLRERVGADGVAGIIDLRRILAQCIVVRRLQKLYRRSGAEVRAADTDHDKDVAVLLYFLCGSLDTGELFLIIVIGKRQPAGELLSETLLGMKSLMSRLDLILDSLVFAVADKTF